MKAEPAPPAAVVAETSFDEIVERWWTALAASESAHRAAERVPGGRRLPAGTRPPASERAEVIRLLKQLEHDLNEHSRLLPWLERPSITNRMLGLPAGVRVCIFELDGVLTMSSEVHATAWAETFDRFLQEQAHSHHRPYIPFDTRHDYEDLVAGRPRLGGIRSSSAAAASRFPRGARTTRPTPSPCTGLRIARTRSSNCT